MSYREHVSRLSAVKARPLSYAQFARIVHMLENPSGHTYQLA
jgi:hypothetical protein